VADASPPGRTGHGLPAQSCGVSQAPTSNWKKSPFGERCSTNCTFDIPGGVLKYYDWMNTPDHDAGIWFAIRRGVSWHTIMEEWPRIKADIDSGMLSPLALVTVYTADATMMGHNHQVAAYAYEVDDANRLTLHLYDPNTAPPGADDVQLSIDLSNPTHTSPITHNVNMGEPIRGFFRTTYLAANPTMLEPATPLPSNAYFAGVSSCRTTSRRAMRSCSKSR
jgi:hypothetical protein